jgi:ComF family protein
MFRPIVDGVLAAVLSAPCVVCGQILDRPMAGPVCVACWTSVRLISPPLCDRCGYPLPAALPHGSSTCPACRKLNAIGLLRAAGAYEGTLRHLLHALKYTRRRSLAARLARLTVERADAILSGADVAVPVPLHPFRLWTRGFNQADLLARGVGLPVRRLLRRRRATPPQSSRSGAARTINVRNAFALARPLAWTRRQVEGRVIVLVDDVSTTGATLDECALVLREAGAHDVRAVVVARTLLYGGRETGLEG